MSTAPRAERSRIAKGAFLGALLGLLGSALFARQAPAFAVSLPILGYACGRDFEDFVLPDECTLGAAAISAVVVVLLGLDARAPLLGLAAGLGIGVLTCIMLRRNGFGMGDAKLLGAVGVAGGPVAVFGALAVGCPLAIAWRLLTRRWSAAEEVAAGPWLLAGAVVAVAAAAFTGFPIPMSL